MMKKLVWFFCILLSAKGVVFSQIDTVLVQENLQTVRQFKQEGQLNKAVLLLQQMAHDHWMKRAFPTSLDYYQQCLALYQQLQDSSGISQVYANLGMIHADMRQYKQSVLYMEAYLEGLRHSNRPSRLLSGLMDLAIILTNLKRHEQAISRLTEAKHLAQELGETDRLKTCYGMLAESYEALGDLEQTRIHFELYRSFHEMIQREKDVWNSKKLAEAKAKTKFLEIQQKNQELELELRNQELKLRQEQLAQKQKEIQEIESLLVQFDSTNRALILHADKRDLVIMTLEEQERSKKLALEKASMHQQLLMGVLIFFSLMAILLLWYIKHKHRIAEQLQRKNQEILQGKEQLLRINQQLSAAVEEAKEASQAKSQFLSTISHEIRTPMNSVIGFTNLLRMDNPLPHQDQYLKTLEFSANHLLALINDVLDFSKIEAGKLELELAPVNLGELMTHLRETFLPKADQADISLKVEAITKKDIWVLGDIVRLNQVLTNLVGNAIKFTKEGGVSISYEVVEELDQSLRCRMAVADTGIGISAEKCEAIFEQFTQANADTTRKFGGTGLGLAISKHLTHLMDGRIWVESEEGKGSVFFVEIVFEAASPAGMDTQPQTVSQSTEIQDFEGMSILVADDNPINIVIVEEFLQRWKVEVETAENGEEAAQMVLEYPGRYDLVLMDLQMPIMDGYEATLRIRQEEDPYFQQLGIIALTASASVEVQSRVESSQMNGFLSKPFNPQDLFDKLKPYYRHSEKLSMPQSSF